MIMMIAVLVILFVIFIIATITAKQEAKKLLEKYGEPLSWVSLNDIIMMISKLRKIDRRKIEEEDVVKYKFVVIILKVVLIIIPIVIVASMVVIWMSFYR